MPETLKIHMRKQGSVVTKGVLNLRKRFYRHSSNPRLYRTTLSHSSDEVVKNTSFHMKLPGISIYCRHKC